MLPDVFHWGFIHIRSYGLMLATAFLVGTWLGLREARRMGLDPDHLVSVVLAALVASVVGARLLYVLEHVDEFRGHWPSVFAVWEGGLTLYGGVIAGTIAGLVAARRLGLPVWRTADALAPSIALGTMFGRIGCFLNGCCYGRPTHMPWGVVYPPEAYPALEYGDRPLHPAQLYNALFGLALFAVLWSVRKRVHAAGTLFWSCLVAFSLGRIVLDTFREYEPASRVASIGGLPITESQLTSVALALFGALMLLRLRREAASHPAPSGASATTVPAAAPIAPASPPVSDTP